MQLPPQASPAPWRECSIGLVRRILPLLLAVAAVVLTASRAAAAPVIVLGPHGRVTHVDDRFIAGPAITPVPSTADAVTAPLTGALTDDAAGAPPTGGGGIDGAPTGTTTTPTTTTTTTSTTSTTPTTTTTTGTSKHKKTSQKQSATVRSVLTKMVASGAITAAQKSTAMGDFNAALAAEAHLSGTRRTELSAVTATVHDIAVEGELTASELPAIELTLTVNRTWWTTGPLLAADARVMISGSKIEWEYYPGQGIQIQVLGTFGEANGMYQAGASQYGALESLLNEMIPLATSRGGGLTWQYYFNWDGGTPPWTSAMSQATGLEALTHAYQVTHDQTYLTAADQALSVLNTPPPEGVKVATTRGVRFLQYTFAPHLDIINAFLQTLLGLDTFATATGNPIATQLFNEGNAEAQWEVPQFNTGAWSLYSPGDEDDLSYHELVTGFLQKLCTLTGTPVYCTTAQDFTADLTTPPVLRPLTVAARSGHAFDLRFTLSKISHVGITITRGLSTVLSTSAYFGYGTRDVPVSKLAPGIYNVSLTGTDLAGNYAKTTGTLTVRH
jgi:hypothetical protein